MSDPKPVYVVNTPAEEYTGPDPQPMAFVGGIPVEALPYPRLDFDGDGTPYIVTGE